MMNARLEVCREEWLHHAGQEVSWSPLGLGTQRENESLKSTRIQMMLYCQTDLATRSVPRVGKEHPGLVLEGRRRSLRSRSQWEGGLGAQRRLPAPGLTAQR